VVFGKLMIALFELFKFDSYECWTVNQSIGQSINQSAGRSVWLEWVRGGEQQKRGDKTKWNICLNGSPARLVCFISN